MPSMSDLDIVDDITHTMNSIGHWFTGFSESLGIIFIAGAAIYLAYLGWRKYRVATNKV